MCGIAGKVSREGQISRGLVEAMCAAEAHRGPDSVGIHRGDGVAVGTQRLRVIDLATGDQPIYNEDRSVAVALNGEIYNFRELRRELELRGHSFSTGSDTEVIAHLYEERGPELVEDLTGMFAFAVWDASRRRLVLARDRVGKKPLYYAAGEGWIAFASELAALMVDDEIPREIDPSSVDCYLAYGYIPAPWSIWRDVKKLPPAHTLVWEDGDVTTKRYWRLDHWPKRGEDQRELEEELRRLVGAAVRRRMIADVPLGAFLSGGIDSSIVVSEMAAASTDPVKTFSIGFEREDYNELPRARAVAERFGTEHHEFVVEPDAIEVAPRLVRHYGEPFADSSAIPSFYLAELTRRHVTVALNGDGGDESFAGYLRHLANGYTAWLDHVPAALRRPVAGAGRALPIGRDRRGPLPYARRFLASLDRATLDRYADHISVFNAAERESLLDPELRAELDPTRAARTIRAPWHSTHSDSALDVLLNVDVETYLPGDLLVKIDIATMAHSLEARSPLLDHEVMEFAASLPPPMKISRGRKKWILRQAYRERLPASTLDAPKRGFAVPLDSWFRDELRDHVREVLLDRGALGRRYLEPGAVVGLVKEHTSGVADRSAKLWALLMLELWHRESAPTGPQPTATAVGSAAERAA